MNDKSFLVKHTHYACLSLTSLTCIAISSIFFGNDDSIGIMIGDAIDKVGPNGFPSVESSYSFETSVDCGGAHGGKM